MSDRYLRIGDLLKRLPISRATIYRMIKHGKLPKPIKLGSSSVWIESEINAWIGNLADVR